MKKVAYVLLLICGLVSAQKDTLQISQFKTTQIIFNDEVQMVEAGTGDLQVKTKTMDNVLILQSIVPKDDFINTNLFIKTKQKIYNVLLTYGESPKVSTLLETSMRPAVEFNPSGTAYITNQQSSQQQTGSQQPPATSPAASSRNKQTTAPSQTQPMQKSSFGGNTDYIGITNDGDRALVQNLLNRSDIFKPSREYQTSMWFRFFAHYIKDGKFYMKFQVENSSDLDYNIDNFFFSVRNKKRRNTSDTQREVPYIRFVNNAPGIPANSKRYLIFEFNSFTITKDEEFLIELNEKQGSRNFTVGVPYYIINQPIKL